MWTWCNRIPRFFFLFIHALALSPLESKGMFVNLFGNYSPLCGGRGVLGAAGAQPIRRVIPRRVERGFLTLNGMRGDTFISLSYLNQILSADFLSKHSKTFLR